MANYLAMNRDELTAEKAALEAEYKKFQAKGAFPMPFQTLIL